MRAQLFSRGSDSALAAIIRPADFIATKLVAISGGDADTRALDPGANSAHQYNFLASGPLPEKEMVVTGATAALALGIPAGPLRGAPERGTPERST